MSSAAITTQTPSTRPRTPTSRSRSRREGSIAANVQALIDQLEQDTARDLPPI